MNDIFLPSRQPLLSIHFSTESKPTYTWNLLVKGNPSQWATCPPLFLSDLLLCGDAVESCSETCLKLHSGAFRKVGEKKNIWHDFSWFVSFFSLISSFLSLHLSPPSPSSVIPPPRTIKESWLDGWIKRWLQGLVDGGMERGRVGDRCVVMLGFTSLLRSVREEKKGCEGEWRGR